MKWVSVLLLLSTAAARAGAWTQKADHYQIIAGIWASSADTAFDGRARARMPLAFDKTMLETASEYGWNDWLTVLFDTETAYARVHQPPAPRLVALDNAFRGGVRLRLDEHWGVLSAELSYRTAGAFNLAVSADGSASGNASEIRLLYGANFAFMGDDGFIDIQAGERLLTRPRPDETPIDLTCGLWLSPDWLAMVQSFNIISGGNGVAPYRFYRSHKLEVSLVRRLSNRFLAQLGFFFSPAGQNVPVEHGLALSLWTQA